jgi:hypothetical protein
VSPSAGVEPVGKRKKSLAHVLNGNVSETQIAQLLWDFVISRLTVRPFSCGDPHTANLDPRPTLVLQWPARMLSPVPPAAPIFSLALNLTRIVVVMFFTTFSL